MILKSSAQKNIAILSTGAFRFLHKTSALLTAELTVRGVKKAIPAEGTKGIPGSRLSKSHWRP